MLEENIFFQTFYFQKNTNILCNNLSRRLAVKAKKRTTTKTTQIAKESSSGASKNNWSMATSTWSLRCPFNRHARPQCPWTGYVVYEQRRQPINIMWILQISRSFVLNCWKVQQLSGPKASMPKNVYIFILQSHRNIYKCISN